MATEQNGDVPLSGEAQEAKELMQRELLRSMASKMMAAAIEEERQRRIQEQEDLKKQSESEDAVRRNAYEQLMTVQEDLIRSLNLMKVSVNRGLVRGGLSWNSLGVSCWAWSSLRASCWAVS